MQSFTGSEVATMLRRFNSLIKGPKGQISDEELSELHVSLRPALSVDSSLFSSSQRHHVNPLEEGLATRARRSSENGQTSGNGFVIARVPEEEKSWKEGYEHGIIINPLDSPEKKPLSSEPPRENGAAASVPVLAQQQAEALRVLRTSSDAVIVAANHNSMLATSRSTDFHTVVDIPDAQAGSGVDLETVRRSAFTAGPGRTISSWSTDSAAEHCR